MCSGWRRIHLIIVAAGRSSYGLPVLVIKVALFFFFYCCCCCAHQLQSPLLFLSCTLPALEASSIVLQLPDRAAERGWRGKAMAAGGNGRVTSDLHGVGSQYRRGEDSGVCRWALWIYFLGDFCVFILWSLKLFCASFVSRFSALCLEEFVRKVCGSVVRLLFLVLHLCYWSESRLYICVTLVKSMRKHHQQKSPLSWFGYWFGYVYLWLSEVHVCWFLKCIQRSPNCDDYWV